MNEELNGLFYEIKQNLDDKEKIIEIIITFAKPYLINGTQGNEKIQTELDAIVLKQNEETQLIIKECLIKAGDWFSKEGYYEI